MIVCRVVGGAELVWLAGSDIDMILASKLSAADRQYEACFDVETTVHLHARTRRLIGADNHWRALISRRTVPSEADWRSLAPNDQSINSSRSLGQQGAAAATDVDAFSSRAWFNAGLEARAAIDGRCRHHHHHHLQLGSQ